ncbi:hypothetical protein RRG08_053626 [Elysia crispata]|uniref:Uncharacterized protein n=1 Tax=Elysia crispata TaxID=231223 RepID=A0AAE0Y1F9_9GAST|nr:hypothetical protein RRG08_053626 [Elysia crispata]
MKKMLFNSSSRDSVFGQTRGNWRPMECLRRQSETDRVFGIDQCMHGMQEVHPQDRERLSNTLTLLKSLNMQITPNWGASDNFGQVDDGWR